MSRLKPETPPHRSSKKVASPDVPAPNVCLSDRGQTFNLALVVGGTDRGRRGPFLNAGAADDWLTAGRFALVLALLIAATFPGVLLGSTTFIIRDFGMFGYPLAYYHRQSF